MTRFIAIIALVLAVGFTARADRHIDSTELPADAQTFIKKHYESSTIRECEQDGSYYEVELRNGVDLAFNSKGELMKIDAGYRKVPAEILKQILPQKAYAELETRKILNKVEEVEFKRAGIKVETSEWGDDEYRFDLEGNLLSVTD